KSNFFPVYINDILAATREILIISPFVTSRRVAQMLHYFSILINRQIKVTVITRPVSDFSEKRELAVKQIFKILQKNGINLTFKSKIHQKFAIIDQKTVWYGSINLLSFGNAEESIMRIESGNIANELVQNVTRN
ncbi:MAG: phospholipase D-like domain-containing protein, partial [Patescibacteria group bacterium]